MATYGEIRQALGRTQARWQVDPTVPNDAQVPIHPLGVASEEHLVRAADVPQVDLAALLERYPTANHLLAARRAALGLPTGPLAVDAALIARAAPQTGVGAAGLSIQVDWRNRWGTNWVTDSVAQFSAKRVVLTA